MKREKMEDEDEEALLPQERLGQGVDLPFIAVAMCCEKVER